MLINVLERESNRRVSVSAGVCRSVKERYHPTTVSQQLVAPEALPPRLQGER